LGKRKDLARLLIYTGKNKMSREKKYTFNKIKLLALGKVLEYMLHIISTTKKKSMSPGRF